MTVDTIIEARWLIPIMPKRVILENHSLVVVNGSIHDILPTQLAKTKYPDAKEVVQLPKSVLMPGFVNLHSHAKNEPPSRLRG